MSVRSFFTKSQRITSKAEFDSIYATGQRRTVGPLLIHVARNQFKHSRLGLSVPKRVGNAVTRNKMKRRCREGFRLIQHGLPEGIDIVVTVRPHEPLSASQYSDLIVQGVS